MKRDNPEQRLQIAVAQYLGHALKPPTIWTAFPAGGGGRIRGALLKAMGLKAGWPDLFVLHFEEDDSGWRSPIVLGIELKAEKGTQTSEQEAVAWSFELIGAEYRVCRSVEEVESALRFCGIPLSSTVGRAG